MKDQALLNHRAEVYNITFNTASSGSCDDRNNLGYCSHLERETAANNVCDAWNKGDNFMIKPAVLYKTKKV